MDDNVNIKSCDIIRQEYIFNVSIALYQSGCVTARKHYTS